MKLNPTNCAFGGFAREILGPCGAPKRNRKEVQSLVGKIVALGGFIAKISNKCKPLLESIKKTKEIKWGEEQDEAPKQIKDYLTSLPILSSLEPGEELFLDLSNYDVSVSAVLFSEENKKQRPIFYVSKMMTEAKKKYDAMEKLILVLVHAKRKLRHYIESDSITVLTNQPLKAVLSKPNLTGRLTKWAIELGVYDIHIKPKTSKEGQVEADFISECTKLGRTEFEREEKEEEI